MDGYITSYESFATMEGPGIRFAVFMSGCNLRCAYCHNPDIWATGKRITSAELVKIILRYKSYFKNGGGVTFSGGEPLVQADFLIEVAKLLKQENINIAIDTACSILGESQKELYTYCDLVIADLKFPSPSLYTQYCKNSVFDTVIDTLGYLNTQNINVWLRTVILPGINDTEKFIDDYFELIKDYTNIKKYELKPFHTMGFEKYERLKIENPLSGFSGLTEEKLDILKTYLTQKQKSYIIKEL